MTPLHQAAQMALDALDAITDDVDGTGLNTMPSFDKAIDAIAALREALAAPEPEPVAWYLPSPDGDDSIFRDHRTVVACTGNKWEGFLPLYAAPPAAPADDHATPSGGQEAGPQEDRIEAAYWRFDARHKGYSQWKTAPMSERDAFKAEMRNALEAEKVRAEMRLVARGWRRPDAPAAPAVPLTIDQEKALSAEAKTGPFQHTTPIFGNDMQSGETPRLSSNRHAGSTPPAAPAPAVPLQGGLDNNELLAAWQKKLPGKVPEGQELNAFAVGTEVGFEHAQRLERMDWDRVHHVLAKHGKHPGRTDDHLADVIDKALSAAPAAPVPDGWVMVPRGLLRRLIAEALTFDPSLQDKEAIEQAKQLAASPAAPAAPPAAPAPAQPVPLTQDQIADCTRTAHRACDAKGPMTRWSTEFARAIEAAHGITGGSNAT